jgi:hypothetical protein
VFVLENDPIVGRETSKRPQYFWLCRSCSSKMTLRLRADTSVVPVVLRHKVQEQHNEPVLDSPDRNAGLTLRNIKFPEHHSSRRKIAHSIAGVSNSERLSAAGKVS